jgi:phage recombination protein Bet
MAKTEVQPEPPENGYSPEPSKQVVRLPVPLTLPARFGFDNEQLALIKQTVARGADTGALLMFLELTARYKLDPFAGQVYLAKMPGKDGEPPSYKTIVARDGLLVIANRYETFGGMEGDVIYASDIIERTPEGFVHTYAAVEAEKRMKQDIIGAWCRVFREGRRPTFFLAKHSSYRRANKSWGQYPDAMILKVAESMALRKAFSITGLVPEDEVGARYDEKLGGIVEQEPMGQEPDWGPDPELAKRLQIAFAEANRVRPGSFLPQKIRLTLAGVDQVKRTEILQQVVDYVLKHGGSIPIEGEVVEDAPVPAA